MGDNLVAPAEDEGAAAAGHRARGDEAGKFADGDDGDDNAAKGPVLANRRTQRHETAAGAFNVKDVAPDEALQLGGLADHHSDFRAVDPGASAGFVAAAFTPGAHGVQIIAHEG